jgi:hypothetical protein
LRYFTNQDTDIHPRTEQWSNGVNQADELDRLMKVRRAALGRIGEHTIRLGAPMTTIEEPLVPIWMYHRYAVEGAASMLGGQDFIYAMRGDGRQPMKWESAVNQRKALESLSATLKPSELDRAEDDPRQHPAPAPGLGHPPRALPAHDRRGLRPAQPGDHRLGRDDRLHPSARSRCAAGGPARRRSGAAWPEEVVDRLVKATFDAATATP